MILKRFIFLTSLVFLICGCSNTSKPKEAVSTTVSMPSGWDDSVIDKIKAGQSTKKRIAIMDFEGSDKIAMENNLEMADILITSLAKTKRFELIERNKLDKILNEQKLSMQGLINEESAVEVGKLSGAEYVVIGNITSATAKPIDKFGYILVKLEVSIDVRVVDATTGKILLSESATGNYESKIVMTADEVVVSGELDYTAGLTAAARDAIDKIGTQIARLSPQIGFVLSVDGNNVTVDIGEEQGVIIGNKLVIFRIGDEVIHPATKKHVGWKKELLAEIKSEKSEKTMSIGSIILKQPNAEIKSGDYVISK